MLIYQLCFSGFSLDPLDMGDVSPPPQTSAGDKVFIWGFTRKGGHRHYEGGPRHYEGGPKSDRLYQTQSTVIVVKSDAIVVALIFQLRQ